MVCYSNLCITTTWGRWSVYDLAIAIDGHVSCITDTKQIDFTIYYYILFFFKEINFI